MLYWIRVKLAWKRFLLSWRFLFAHHPLCDSYRDQVFLVFGVYLCQGCTLLYSGLLLGLVFFLFVETASLSLFHWLFIVTLLVIPSFLTLISQFHFFKKSARLMNGAGFSAIFWGTASLSLLEEKIILIFYMIVLFILFTLIRTKLSDQRNLCSICDEKNLPICSGYRVQAKIEEKMDEYTIKLLQDK
ncbi:MAG: hypothetical protein ACTSYA_04945 [Candidatus Kariarchaeaceae archaeon]